MLIDTHCHLNLEDAFPNPGETIREAVEAGVSNMIVVGIDEASSRRAVRLADDHKEVYAVVGHHPNSAATFSTNDLVWIENLLAHPKTVALGEIGLDFHWDYATPEQQQFSLNAQLDLAVHLGMPVVFHCRKAYRELLQVLETRSPHPYLFHCFSGSDTEAQRVVELGGLLGVDGPITYKKSTLPSLFASLPADRIVVETDAPYMPPEPFRGRPNHPKHVVLVNRALALALGVTEEESAETTTANAEGFFRTIRG
ncbi:MAG TPA: TatD family hydrolase [Fimbriimonadaceae bacterium]|nr:TatD family hydrolase [Fimbriimonadaceae bacterium]